MAIDITHELRIRVDLKSGLVTMPQRTHLTYMDAAADRIVAEIVEDGKPVTLTGVSCTGKFYRPPNREEIALKGDINGSAASVTLNEHCYTAEGQYEAEIKLTQGSVTRTILSITGYVHRAGSGAIVDISGVVPSIDALLAQIQATKDAAAAATLAANGAKLATDEANRAALKLEGMTASAVRASAPSATVMTKDGNYHVTFGLVTPNITFEVETGQPGTQVQIAQSGTAEAPVVKLTIPRGDTGAVDGIDYYAGNPAPLGTASPGTANGVARGNHVHPMLTADDMFSIQHGAWDGNTLPGELPPGISCVGSVANQSAAASGFPIVPATCLAVNVSEYRRMQIVIGKDTGVMYTRTAISSSAWNGWVRQTQRSLDELYPVGSIVMFNSTTISPAALYGGTWMRIYNGVLMGGGGKYPVGSTGGRESVTLARNNIPPLSLATSTPSGSLSGYAVTLASGNYQINTSGKVNGDITAQPFSILQPYKAVAIWERVEDDAGKDYEDVGGGEIYDG